MNFNKKELRVIRLALSHYAYRCDHKPKQDYGDKIQAVKLCRKLDIERFGDTEKIGSMKDYLGGVIDENRKRD